MNDQQFADLVKSIKQAGKIKKGQRKPSRVFEFSFLGIKVTSENPEVVRES